MVEALLVVHIIICIALVVSILMQRSEGGGALGIGGGPSGLMSSRSAANFMTRTTAILATLFFITSISLVIVYGGSKATTGSVMGQGRDSNGLPTKSIDLGNSAKPAAPQTTDGAIPQSQAAPQTQNAPQNSDFNVSTVAPASQQPAAEEKTSQNTDKNSK